MSLFSGKTYDVAAGRESRSAFIAVVAFWFCAFRFATHDLSLKVGHWFEIHFGKMDASLLAAFLLPCLSLYFGRRLFPDGLQMTKGPMAPPPSPKPIAEGPAG